MASKGLMAASTKPLILTILLEGESYGYEIIQRMKDLSSQQLEWTDGMLYPVLHRMEKEGLIASQWLIENERRRKYYSITKTGKQELKIEREEWQNMNDLLTRIWAMPQFQLKI